MKFFALYTGAAFFFTYCNLFASDSLIQAAQDNNTFRLYQLLSDNADPNARDQATGNTALHYAVEQNNIPMATLLLMRNADRNRVNNNGKKAVDLVPAKNYDLRQIRRLFKKNCLSHCTDPYREKLLIYYSTYSKGTRNFNKMLLTFPLTAAQITPGNNNTVKVCYKPELKDIYDKKNLLRRLWPEYIEEELNKFCATLSNDPEFKPAHEILTRKEQECLHSFKDMHAGILDEISTGENAGMPSLITNEDMMDVQLQDLSPASF